MHKKAAAPEEGGGGGVVRPFALMRGASKN
jgi:hypothetical protein